MNIRIGGPSRGVGKYLYRALLWDIGVKLQIRSAAQGVDSISTQVTIITCMLLMGITYLRDTSYLRFYLGQPACKALYLCVEGTTVLLVNVTSPEGIPQHVYSCSSGACIMLVVGPRVM